MTSFKTLKEGNTAHKPSQSTKYTLCRSPCRGFPGAGVYLGSIPAQGTEQKALKYLQPTSPAHKGPLEIGEEKANAIKGNKDREQKDKHRKRGSS